MQIATLYRRFRVHLFWIATAFTYGAAIMPMEKAPSIGAGDKFDHMAAFLALTLLARSAYWARPGAILGIGLSAFGVLIELSQTIPILNRDASVADWVADSLAIVLGLGLSIFLAKLFPIYFKA